MKTYAGDQRPGFIERRRKGLSDPDAQKKNLSNIIKISEGKEGKKLDREGGEVEVIRVGGGGKGKMGGRAKVDMGKGGRGKGVGCSKWARGGGRGLPACQKLNLPWPRKGEVGDHRTLDEANREKGKGETPSA